MTTDIAPSTLPPDESPIHTEADYQHAMGRIEQLKAELERRPPAKLDLEPVPTPRTDAECDHPQNFVVQNGMVPYRPHLKAVESVVPADLAQRLEIECAIWQQQFRDNIGWPQLKARQLQEQVERLRYEVQILTQERDQLRARLQFPESFQPPTDPVAEGQKQINLS